VFVGVLGSLLGRQLPEPNDLGEMHDGREGHLDGKVGKSKVKVKQHMKGGIS